MGEQIVQLLRRESLSPRQVGHDAGIDVAGSRTHDQSACRGEPHARVDAPTLEYRGDAGAVSQVREDNASSGGSLSGHLFEFVQQIGVRQAMEAVASNACRLVRAGNRQNAGHVREIVMKRRIETRDLR